MEALKVLIIEDEFFSKVEKSLKELLSALGLEGIFYFATNYDEAIEKISKERFNIVSLDDFLDDEAGGKETNSLIGRILGLNPGACVFSLVSEIHQSLVEGIKKSGIKHFFAKSDNFGIFEDIIHPEDAKEIKEAIIETGVVSFQKAYKDLVKPVCVFSKDFVKSRPSEKMVKDSCDYIATDLNKEKINYSVVVQDAFVEIFVEADSISFVKKVALKNDLIFLRGFKKNV